MSNMLCDHCESGMDDPVEGMHGEYCSTQCYYAEELDGPAAHGDFVSIEECPGCSTAEAGDE